MQASKGDTFSEALYMETALMQQPSHIRYVWMLSTSIVLQVEDGSRIELTFHEFRTESSPPPLCRYDYVKGID